MAHFYLYSSEIDDHTRFGEIGQSALCADSSPQKFRFGKGPDGAHGCFWFWLDAFNPEAHAQPTFNPATQSWQLAPGGKFWIGWIEEIPGVNCQAESRDELLETLQVTLSEAIQLNREFALREAREGYQEEKVTV